MPTAVAAARQSYADHPMVRLETAPPGPCHAVSLQETPSDPCSTSATVILSSCHKKIAIFVAVFGPICDLIDTGMSRLPAGFC